MINNRNKRKHIYKISESYNLNAKKRGHKGSPKCNNRQRNPQEIQRVLRQKFNEQIGFSGETNKKIFRGEEMKKEETNDIVQYLIPKFKELNIPIENCKIDVTTEKSGNKRGDIWISTEKQGTNNFEENIIALIEAKHKNSTIGDMDWRDAMGQGKTKSLKQGLTYYAVTNCRSEIRFYNSSNDEEIVLDGKVIVSLVPLEVLQKIQTQITKDNSYVIHKVSNVVKPISENKFRTTLGKLADIYRSAGLKKGDERIDPTISFVVLRYISEKEQEKRNLNKKIKLWHDFKKIAEEKELGDLRANFDTMVNQIWGLKSQYKNNIYKDFKDLIILPSKLKDEHFKKIYQELDEYHFHGANFDLFGAIYEEFASQTKKKEFGEFYTRRHITGVIARLLLRNETNPRELKIADPACGSGGFLTEAYKSLILNYSAINKLNQSVMKNLQENVFWGYDNDEKSVARTKLNMFLVGDGHIHIYENDSLNGWNKEIDFVESSFDYILTNPPMGSYDGEVSIDNYDFTNESRYELMFVEKVIKTTKTGGEIAIVVNDGALETPSRANFRKKILEHCNVYAVISLTKFAFAPYTKEKTYVIFMQKKQDEDIGNIQKFPIWHFIVDYDSYANSDKRYKTKYHDDLPELEEKFDEAVGLSILFLKNKAKYETKKVKYEREVNEREKQEELTGLKFAYVEMSKVNEHNFYNLLSEYHLRPYKLKKISEDDFDKKLNELKIEIINVIGKDEIIELCK